MSMGRTCSPHSFLVLLTLAATLGLASGAYADFDREFSIEGEHLLLGSLVGDIVVEGHSGSNFEVKVSVKGQDASEELIAFEQSDGRSAELLVMFPIEDERDYVYPRMGRGRTRIEVGRKNGSRDHWMERLFDRKHRVEVRGRGRGLEVWADITVRVPNGKDLTVQSGVGTITASNVQGNLELDIHSGTLTADDIKGDVLLDTGSGSVDFSAIEGNLTVDTGSGHVEGRGVKGNKILIDTGSGHVDVSDLEADDIDIDTGSGRVTLDTIECANLRIDTGSGGVDARELGSGRVEIDTGSGSVDLDFTRMGAGPYHVDTGSGSIHLSIPQEGVSASVNAETGSGGIDVRVDGIDMRKKRRDHVAFDIGSGETEIELDTGSGSIRIRQR